MSYNRCSASFRYLIVLSVAVLASLAPTTHADQKRNFRFAIVGLVHGHAWGHLRNMAAMISIDLVGIADPHADLREEAAQYAPGVPLFEHYRKLLDETNPDAVWAFVENDRHLELTRACASRGLHIIFEKPMAATYDQARQMLEIARSNKIKLMVNYQMAWWPENYTAYDLANSGALGKIWRVRSIIGHGGPGPRGSDDVRRQRFFAWLNDEARGGGALMDFSCYGAVWLRWYLGLPKTVYAITRHTRPEKYQTNTSATILADFAGGGVGMIEASWDLPRGFQDVEVFGDKGSVHMSRNKIEAYIGRDRRELPAGNLEESRRDPISYFVNVVRSNEPVDGMVSPEFNADVMQIVEAARLSAENGKPITLPLR